MPGSPSSGSARIFKCLARGRERVRGEGSLQREAPVIFSAERIAAGEAVEPHSRGPGPGSTCGTSGMALDLMEVGFADAHYDSPRGRLSPVSAAVLAGYSSTRSVVQVGIPAPKKSRSSVQIGHDEWSRTLRSGALPDRPAAWADRPRAAPGSRAASIVARRNIRTWPGCPAAGLPRVAWMR